MRRALVLLPLLLALGARAQDSARLVQLSGLVLDADTRRPVPWADVVLPASGRGTAADARGFYSLAARAGDSLRVSALGYKPWRGVVPDTGRGILQGLVVGLVADTIRLREADVFPWPSRGDLRRALLATDVHAPEDDISTYAGFHRVDKPREPKATPLSPASFFYEQVVRKIAKAKRKRGKAKELPTMP